MANTRYIQWINENEGRAYPIAETATQVDRNGQRLPTDILGDLCLMLPPEHQAAYVSSLRVTQHAIFIGISSPLSGLFIGTFRRNALQPYTSYPLTPVISDITGWISFGNFVPQGITDYRFDSPEQSQIESRAIRLIDALPVKRFIKFGGSDESRADKIVTFRGGGGLYFEIDERDPTRKTIVARLKPEVKELFIGPCNEWADQDICGAPPMRSFNGVCPDEDGRITLRFE